jgi:putative endonuclease
MPDKMHGAAMTMGIAKHGARRSCKRSRASYSMHYVYLLRSLADPMQTYVGYSTDLKTRLRTHNAGGSPHMSKYRPWGLVTYLAFIDKFQALEFERYLKSHSGQAFAAKRLWRR